MKIDAMSGYPAFHKTNKTTAPAKAAQTQETTSKTDVAVFSRGQTAAPDKNLLSLKAGIMGEISQPADPARLEDLKTKIRDGSYRPSTDAMVDAILGKTSND